MKMDLSPPQNLKILCFGNSLTAGYTAMGYAYYPYADVLELSLARLFPSTKLIIKTSGLPGDRVVGSGGMFLSRMRNMCEKAISEGAPYDWVIVLGGTNDLGWFGEPKVIYDGLSRFCHLLLLTFMGSRGIFARNE